MTAPKPSAGTEGPSLASLQRAIRAFRDARDWGQFHTLKDLAMAISVEAAELQEELLWIRPEEESARLDARRSQIADELADVLIYCLHFAEVASIDPASAVLAKLRRNEDKYPVEAARGSAKKQGDLEA